jgi:hypothetical protein
LIRRIELLVIVSAFFGLLLAVPSASADSGPYPLFATPDGAAVEVDAALGVTPGGGEVSVPLSVSLYAVVETPADPEPEPDAPPGNFKRTLWAYEAAPTGARILQYDIGPPVTAGPTCVPNHETGFLTSQNGRGIAFDPLDGNLWNTHVSFPGFNGDGFIHKNTPPSGDPLLPSCAPVTSLPFGDGPGGEVQDDIGALDVDEASKHIWAAGYKPVNVGGVLLSFIYKVNRNNGRIINSCALPFRGGGVGNDTLAVFRDTSLPGSSKYLLTDAGGRNTTPNSYALIDQASCHSGEIVTPVAEFEKTTPNGVTGIDFEWPGLLNTNEDTLFNNGDDPFTTPVSHGEFGNSRSVQDITLCGFRAAFGGDGNDMCQEP